MAAKIPAKKNGTPAVAPVAGAGGPQSVPREAIARASAQAGAIRHGGNAGGRKTKDGLVPGSEEHKERIRREDAERNRINRAADASANPPPILSNAGEPGAPLVPLVPGAVPGVAPVPWTPDMLTDAVEAILGTGEDVCKTRILKRAGVLGLPKVITEKALAQAAWGDGSKKALMMGLPEALADGLNAAGISSAWRKWLSIGIGVLGIANNQLAAERTMVLYARTHPDECKKPEPAAKEGKP